MPISTTKSDDRPICLITGAEGFLGAYLRAEAAERGYRVSSSAALWLPHQDFAALVESERPKLLLHAAGPSSVAASFAAPEAHFQGAVAATQCVLEAVRKHSPACRVVYFSSAAVYGNPQAWPIAETAPTQPISPYGFHKRMAENLVQQYAQLHGVWAVSLRIFSAYGLGLRRQVVFELLQRVRQGEVLRLDGTGEESRDFIHARDVARAVFTVAESAQGQGEVYNLARGEELPMRALAAVIRRLSVPGEVAFSGTTRVGDPTRWWADCRRLEALGWAPTVSLEAGLRELWSAIQREREAPRVSPG